MADSIRDSIRMQTADSQVPMQDLPPGTVYLNICVILNFQ